MNFLAIEKRLTELERSYQEWAGPINAVINENFQRINRDGYKGDDFFKQVQKAREKRLSEHDPYLEAYLFFDELVPLYQTGDDSVREFLRQVLKKNSGMLHAMLGYIHRCANTIHTQSDAKKLDAGLTAACLENSGSDYRDTLLALAELFVAAENAGLDPSPRFQFHALLADHEKRLPGNTSMQEVLSNFHTYAVLQERRQRGGFGKWKANHN